MQFDASIDLTTNQVPAHVPPPAAVERVRTAVGRLPGADWISVEWCGECPPVEWVRVYRYGYSTITQGEPWDTIKTDIKAMVATVPAGDFT